MGVGSETTRNKKTGVQDHQKGIREEEWRRQLTESAGVVEVDDHFSWC